MSRSDKTKAAKAAASRRSATAARQSPRSPVVVPPRRLDLSKIRHDLRTPINHILGYCEMLQEDEQLPAIFAPDLAKIHAGGRQLVITEPLLRVSGVLAAFTGMYFTVVLSTDATYREEFAHDVAPQIRQVFAVHMAYLHGRQDPAGAG